MFSNKGNINKNSSGNNHIAGDNNIIKNESNDTINNTNNYYGISWKFITRILPSPKHTNKRNVAIGWLYLGLLIFTNIFRTFGPIESSKHFTNSNSSIIALHYLIIPVYLCYILRFLIAFRTDCITATV